MASRGGARARGSGRHSAERWSGHETDDMKGIGSSLLFPANAEFEFELKEFRLSPGGLRDACKGMLPPGVSCEKPLLLTFRQRPSPYAKTLCAPCLVAGLCEIKQECIKELTMMHLPRKEQRKNGRSGSTQLDWHGILGCLTCPQCARVAAVGDTCFLVFYGVAQLLMSATPFVLAARAAPRFVCQGCLQGMALGKPVKNSELVVGPDATADEYLGLTTLNVFFPDGVSVQCSFPMGARSLYFYCLDGYMSDSVEPAFVNDLQIAGQALLNDMRMTFGGGPTHVVVDPQAAKALANRKIEEGVCFVCRAQHAPKRCARCKKVWYCGKDCQRKDWKRHKITECIPPS